ncbi:putative membrane protein [Pullulanibacillus pueri]|uniref:DUF2269 family protein n=1 Tax=Pullulanibacillus pueri TaxID=1437324 RepID=A0A8J2ZS54_9BACL|nr:DUF2269 family protein [Pullulanibacillus pueri]MBM7679997.1 putative membrane protein [Pullulanibacillus pueri]GGH73855.1 hypothetical protein GCM10007096_01510 [Pullulanibacillus pueri]
MDAIYQCLVVIHIFSAVLGLGPGFVFFYIKRSAHTITELRHSYFITQRLHRVVMVGGFSLLITGILMGALNPVLFQQGWYLACLILFLLGLAMGPSILAPRTKRMKYILTTCKSEEIPEEYKALAQQLLRFELLLNALFLIILALMILKPF